MKTILLTLLAAATAVHAQQSTLGEGDSYAWAANFGWIEMTPNRPNTGDGFRFGEFSCSGYLWSANTGWIHCGDGTPANGIQYSNNSNTDYGVNHVGTGELSGLAWSANTGWINLGTGIIKTDSMPVTDSDNDGISDAFEIAYTNDLEIMTASSDFDGDGHSDKDEYIALTNPFSAQSFLRVTAIAPVNPDGSATSLSWVSSPARRYVVERSTDLGVTNPWHPSPLDAPSFGADSGSETTRTTLDVASPKRFFRVKAIVPLQP